MKRHERKEQTVVPVFHVNLHQERKDLYAENRFSDAINDE